MFFQTYRDFEANNKALNSLAGPEAVFYPFFEVILNDFIYHVDATIQSPDNDEENVNNRYIFSDIIQVFHFVNMKSVSDFNISIQLPRYYNEEDHEYSISTVVEIFKAEDSTGRHCFVFHCKDGKKVTGPFSFSNQKLTNLHSIYKEGQKPSLIDIC
jgi:hypothetical protein